MENVQSQGNRFLEVSMTRGTKIFLCPLLWVHYKKRKQLEMLNVVSGDENAYWLIDYWCGKDVKGLIQMPFSRHWIMHIEACIKIRDKQFSKR